MKTRTLDITQSSADILRVLLTDLHPATLAGMSRRMRSNYRHTASEFEVLDERQAKRLIRKHTDPVAAAIVLSMHRDGRVRSFAVRSMRTSTDPIVVPFLLLRSGEWTATIRHEAIAALDRWIQVDHADVLLYSYPLLQGERFTDRHPGSETRDRIEEVLQSPGAEQAVLAAIGLDQTTRRTAIRIAIAQQPSIDLLRRALATGDVVAIGLVSRSLATDGSINQQVGELLWQHPTTRLRQEGVFRLLKHGGPQAEVVAVEAMKDRSESVRYSAQQWFRNHGREVVAFYRSLPPSELLAALLGLSDSPDEADASLARASLGERPAIRRAAIHLLSNLGHSSDERVFVEAFVNGSGRERRSAVRWFRRTGVTTEQIEDMWLLWSPDADRDVRLDLLRLLVPMTTVWSQIELALRAIETADRALSRFGVQMLLLIIHQASGFRSRPNPELLARLRVALEEARPAMTNVFPRNHVLDDLDRLLSQ